MHGGAFVKVPRMLRAKPGGDAGVGTVAVAGGKGAARAGAAQNVWDRHPSVPTGFWDMGKETGAHPNPTL